jgi:two-component system LytT family sensor kinase
MTKNNKQNWIDDESLFNLPHRKVTWTRVQLHVLFWVYDTFSAYNAMDRVLRVDPKLPPDPGLFKIMFTTHVLSTVVLFYLFGYLIVPSLMKLLVYNRATGKWLTKKAALVVVTSACVFIIFNVYDYYLFTYAFEHFKPAPAYVQRYNDLLLAAGPVGIFKNYSLFTFIWAYNVSYLMLPLLIRIIREAISWGVESVNQKEQNQILMRNQLHLLQIQINPHFLFNVFNNIYSLIQKTNSQAASLVRGLSDLMRYTLYKTNDEFVPLAGELQFLTNYIDIEKSRQFKPERVQFSQNGLTDGYLIPPLLLVTFIENAFKHGLNNSYEEGWVNISIHIDDQRDALHMKVENHIASTERRNEEEGGVGLVNAQKRLNLLFGFNGFKLDTHAESRSYLVDLELPLKKGMVYEKPGRDSVPNY